MHKYLLGCDWGTTSFRLRLIRLADQSVMDEVVASKGIGSTYNLWKTEENNLTREEFFRLKLKEEIAKLSSQSGIKLDGLSIIISGMASSSIGMFEVEYAQLPFATDGYNAVIHHIDASEDFPHDILLLSGVCSKHDVMRGEETELIGLVELADLQDIDEAIFLFPGTHSKHLYVKNQQLTHFKTYMTGEVFNLMAFQSILKNSVNVRDKFVGSQENDAAFRSGIKESGMANILNALFTVRTNELFNLYEKEQNAIFLSGLLIGSEIRQLVKETGKQLVLCSGNHLYELYRLAMDELQLSDRIITIPPELADKAAVAGQLRIFRHHEHRLTKATK
jgi:2-dehydro-3-deoxygalactonokinase